MFDSPAEFGNCRTVSRGERSFIGPMILCAAALAALFVTGGMKRNPGPVENIVQVLCSGCDRNLKSGTECESCGIWYRNSSGNVKIQAVTDVDLRDSRVLEEKFCVVLLFSVLLYSCVLLYCSLLLIVLCFSSCYACTASYLTVYIVLFAMPSDVNPIAVNKSLSLLIKQS